MDETAPASDPIDALEEILYVCSNTNPPDLEIVRLACAGLGRTFEEETSGWRLSDDMPLEDAAQHIAGAMFAARDDADRLREENARLRADNARLRAAQGRWPGWPDPPRNRP